MRNLLRATLTDALVCVSKSLLIGTQKLPTSHFCLRLALSAGQLNHAGSKFQKLELE